MTGLLSDQTAAPHEIQLQKKLYNPTYRGIKPPVSLGTCLSPIQLPQVDFESALTTSDYDPFAEGLHPVLIGCALLPVPHRRNLAVGHV